MWRQVGAILALVPVAAMADSVVAVRTLPAQSVVEAGDVTLVAAEIDGALTDISAAVGQEVRRTVYAGRPLRREELGAPALVDRNQIVTVVFRSGALSIAAEGRALERGAEGDTIRVMNLASKSTVNGKVAADGRILVGDPN